MDLEDRLQSRLVGCSGLSGFNLDSCSIGLSDDDFVYNGTTYDISNLYIQGNPSGVSLYFGLNVAIPSALKSNATLSYGSTSLALSSFTVLDSGTEIVQLRGRSSVPWTDNQEVTISLTVPSPPTLTVSNRTETGATLTLANHSADWWYKQTAPTAGGTCTSRTAAQTTATLTGLTVNTSYTYKAYSKTGCNAADVIATAMFSTNLDQLPAPTLTGATPGNGQVTLTWNKVTGAAGYQYLVLNADKTRIVSTDWFSGSYGDQTRGDVTGLTNGRPYYFQVRAMKRGPATRYIQWIRGPWSTPPFPATPEGPPPPVENIRVTPNGTSLTVTWDASPGATGYDVTYTDNSSGRTARAAWDHAGTSVTITCDSRYPGGNRDCVRSGATYSVGVRAKNDRGASGWRNSGRPPTEPQPQPPSGDSCQTQLTGDGSVAGFWNERCDSAARRGRYAHYYSFTLAAQSTLTISLESRIDTYLLLRRGGQDGPVLHRNDDWGGSYNSRISETLAAGTYTIEATTYHRWESGNFTLGVSGLGSTAPPQGTDPPPPVDESTAPDTVTNIRVRHNGTSLSVSWDASARATAYDVTYYDTGSRRNWRAAWNRAGTRLRITCDVRPEHSDEGCINSHTYTVGIRARNAAGTSGWTNSGRASEGGSSGSAAPAPALSVADATAAESSGSITFAVTLSPAAARWVYVDYSTHDGTASAGLDYTAGSGTLTFRPGETRKTVTLALLDDAYDEASETLELMLSNAQGAPLEDGLATGTITNDDPVPQSWIGRFGRTVAHQALDAVDARMDSQPLPGMTMTLAGQPVQWPNGSEQSKPVAEQVLEQFSQWVNISSDGASVAVRSFHEKDLLANSSFTFGSPTASGGLFSFWGRGAVSNFDGREGDLTLDGQVTSWMLGTDWSWGQWPDGGDARRSTAGLLLSRSSSDGSYASPGSSGSGDVAATLTGVFPWGSHRFTERLEAWGVAGYGQGELNITPKLATGKNGATLTADLNLWMAAAGFRGTCWMGVTTALPSPARPMPWWWAPPPKR